jgi:hypothetical protein
MLPIVPTQLWMSEYVCESPRRVQNWVKLKKACINQHLQRCVTRSVTQSAPPFRKGGRVTTINLRESGIVFSDMVGARDELGNGVIGCQICPTFVPTPGTAVFIGAGIAGRYKHSPDVRVVYAYFPGIIHLE